MICLISLWCCKICTFYDNKNRLFTFKLNLNVSPFGNMIWSVMRANTFCYVILTHTRTNTPLNPQSRCHERRSTTDMAQYGMDKYIAIIYRAWTRCTPSPEVGGICDRKPAQQREQGERSVAVTTPPIHWITSFIFSGKYNRRSHHGKVWAVSFESESPPWMHRFVLYLVLLWVGGDCELRRHAKPVAKR